MASFSKTNNGGERESNGLKRLEAKEEEDLLFELTTKFQPLGAFFRTAGTTGNSAGTTAGSHPTAENTSKLAVWDFTRTAGTTGHLWPVLPGGSLRQKLRHLQVCHHPGGTGPVVLPVQPVAKYMGRYYRLLCRYNRSTQKNHSKKQISDKNQNCNNLSIRTPNNMKPILLER